VETGFARYQYGMSLIEVMIAVFVMASGLLGLAALQSRSLMFAQSSFYRSVATDLAADLADRIRANRSPFLALDDSAALPTGLTAAPNFGTCTQNTTAPYTPAGCPSTFQVLSDMTKWDEAVRSQLPAGASWTLISVATAGSAQTYRYTLTLTWLDDRSSNTNGTYTTVIE
jgi:type IV pilus assembly protein PilV